MKVFSYPHKSLFSVTPVESSCLVGWFYSMKGIAMLRPMNTFLCLAPFHTIKASQQGECFLVHSRWISLCPVTKVYGIFNNKTFSSAYSNQSRAMTDVWIIFASTGTSLTFRGLPSS